MRKLVVFNHITLDGYFVSEDGDMSWAHQSDDDAEFHAFVASNASQGGTLLFGRVTYDLMASYWPTPIAHEHAPAVAAGMNRLQKVVFSRTLDRVTWQNTTLIKDDMPSAVRRMKQESGDDMVILGSGTIVSQLAEEGLIDEFQLLVNPLVLGKGRTLFEGVSHRLNLTLTKSRTFANGIVLLCYQPSV